MGCWLTTHYRHRSESHPYSIYLKERYKKRAEKINVGDQVAFYELKGSDGGKEAIVAIAEVAGGRRKNIHRDGGPNIADEVWEWELPCTKPNQSGRVPKAALYKILGWQPRRPPLIPGGLMKLDQDQFDEIAKVFGE